MPSRASFATYAIEYALCCLLRHFDAEHQLPGSIEQCSPVFDILWWSRGSPVEVGDGFRNLGGDHRQEFEVVSSPVSVERTEELCKDGPAL